MTPIEKVRAALKKIRDEMPETDDDYYGVYGLHATMTDAERAREAKEAFNAPVKTTRSWTCACLWKARRRLV